MDFVASLVGRSGECRGPLLQLSFSGYRLEVLEESLRTADRLWDGFDGDSGGLLAFSLCAAHWMDLSYLSGVRAREYHRLDWFNEASALLRQICEVARWDEKEISNMLTWQRVQLT